MNTESQLQTELEAMQASERVARENLRELARLVLVYGSLLSLYEELGDSRTGFETDKAEREMTNFAKGVAQ